MKTLSIITAPDKRLQRKAKAVTKFGKQLKELVNAMFATMEEAKGIGLAAMQVGRLENVFVIHIPATEKDDQTDATPEFGKYAMINTQIIAKEGEQAIEEGCLSLPNVNAEVKRYAKIKIAFQDVQGKRHIMVIEGLPAICVQHEMDHLKGILFIDHLDKETRQAFLTQLQAAKTNAT